MNNEMMNNDAITTKKIVIDGSLITTKEEFYDLVDMTRIQAGW